MQIERLIREQIYLVKRRSKGRLVRRHAASYGGQRKLWGLLFILVGMILVFTKCSRGSSAKEKSENQSSQNSIVKERVQDQNINNEHVGSFLEYIQDFDINENTLVQLQRQSIKYRRPFSDTLAIWEAENYKGSKVRKINKLIKQKEDINVMTNASSYEDAAQIYRQFIYDIVSFPLAGNIRYTFENGWKEGRTYKGTRKHYGIDIMDPDNIPGKIKIYSVTDGVIENIGWNEVGGYRVGIRSNGGAYFYYAHLYENPSHIKKGDRVCAGDYIGDMGNTGYGEEGTKGLFPVHLHIGIAVKIKGNEEFWVNPYYILKYLELKDFTYYGI